MDNYKEIKRKINLANAYLDDMNNFIESKLEKLNIKEAIGEKRINILNSKNEMMLYTSLALITQIEDMERIIKAK